MRNRLIRRPCGCIGTADEIMRLRLAIQETEQQLAAVRTKIEQIVCTDERDAGVILLSSDSPTHPEVRYSERKGVQTVQVNDHAFFSPLGDALIELWEMTKRDA